MADPRRRGVAARRLTTLPACEPRKLLSAPAGPPGRKSGEIPTFFAEAATEERDESHFLARFPTGSHRRSAHSVLQKRSLYPISRCVPFFLC
jgi:hypothetical protein